MESRKALYLASLIPLLIFGTILIIGGVLYNGKTPSDWYMVLWNLLPLFLALVVILPVIVFVIYMFKGRSDIRNGRPTLSSLEDPYEYEGMTLSQQLDMLEKYAPEDMSPTVFDLPYLKSISHSTIKVVLYSRTGLMYQFESDGENIGLISGNYSVVEVPQGQHMISIRSGFGREIFSKSVVFDRVWLFTVNKSRNGESVKIEEIH